MQASVYHCVPFVLRLGVVGEPVGVVCCATVDAAVVEEEVPETELSQCGAVSAEQGEERVWRGEEMAQGQMPQLWPGVLWAKNSVDRR